MARTPWSFDGYEWPINPEPGGDTGWIPGETQLSELVPIDVYKSSVQIGGAKSERRQIRGWIWGPDSNTFYAKFMTWRRDRKKAILRDHLGESRTALLVNFSAEAMEDPKAWSDGRQTWKYTAEFLEM